ncbi:MAG: methyl-accepting chemotaxis protein [Negativicutes bacterium]|nr:methyl-accepting chemotaxis protein [Negativicutes bacterium]
MLIGKSIRARLTFVMAILLIGSLSLMAGVSYYFSQQALSASVDETARAIGADYSSKLQSTIEKLVIQLEDLASIQRMRTANDPQQIMEAMKEAHKRIGQFDYLMHMDLNGFARRTNGTADDLSSREYFKRAVATQRPVVSEPLLVKGTGKLSVNIAVPILDNGVLKGVVVGNLPLDTINKMVSQIYFLQTGYGVLVDDGGTVLSHPKKPEINGKLSFAEKTVNPEIKLEVKELDDRLINLFKQTVEQGKQVTGYYRFLSGEQLAIATPIDLPGQRWVLFVTAPEAETKVAVRTMGWTMLGVAILAIVIASFFVSLISGKFAKPIVRMRDEAAALADGDLSMRQIEATGQDELGQLAKSFQSMLNNLRDIVSQVQHNADQVAAASEELTASAEQSAQAANSVAVSISDVAAGATAQLAAADETLAVVEQMSAAIQQMAASANQVAAQSAQAAAKAKDGGTAVERAVDQMANIEDTVNTSAAMVAKLGERSKEIGQIVDSISGIAGQTNLLALNAAIEAARAGEQGRGFAVVAEEVRKLAEQSRDAAKKIAELIKEIQEDTEKAVIAMNDGTREVKTGAEVVNAAGIAFREIADLVTQVSGQVRDISATIQQTAAGSQQIVRSVQRIDKLSKKSADEAQGVSAATEEQLASMEEIATSSEALSKLAQDLQGAVAKFRL